MQYGTIILAEYLDENLTFGGVPGSGDDAVLFTFRRIRDGFGPFPGFATTAQQAIHDVIVQEADGNDALSSMLAGLGVDNYLMDEPTSDGYTDPDAAKWKNQLNGLSPPLRPKVTEVALVDGVLLIDGQIGDLTNAGFDDGLTGWKVIGQADGTVTIDTNGGDTAARLESVTGQPVGIEQWFDGYSSNTVQAIVSAATGTDSIVIVEVFRLDGTLVDIGSASVNQFQGWIPAGDVAWQLGTEDVLSYRLATTAAGGPHLVDNTISGTSP